MLLGAAKVALHLRLSSGAGSVENLRTGPVRPPPQRGDGSGLEDPGPAQPARAAAVVNPGCAQNSTGLSTFKQRKNFAMPGGSRKLCCALAELVTDGNVCTPIEEHLCKLRLALEGCEHQRCPAELVWGVDAKTLVQEPLQNVCVTPPDREL
eukprot:m.329384 g.329384  ORF g.329384 m.329384 type:complete len:152 (-) comp55602_c0_seq20:398-853(-)